MTTVRVGLTTVRVGITTVRFGLTAQAFVRGMIYVKLNHIVGTE